MLFGLNGIVFAGLTDTQIVTIAYKVAGEGNAIEQLEQRLKVAMQTIAGVSSISRRKVWLAGT